LKYLAVFKGRSATIRAGRALEQNAIPFRFVNTPRETGYGCGICIEVAPSYYYGAARVLPMQGFVGWWLLNEVAGGVACTRV